MPRCLFPEQARNATPDEPEAKKGGPRAPVGAARGPRGVLAAAYSRAASRGTTIGAAAFHGRVRDGHGWGHRAKGHQGPGPLRVPVSGRKRPGPPAARLTGPPARHPAFPVFSPSLGAPWHLHIVKEGQATRPRLQAPGPNLPPASKAGGRLGFKGPGVRALLCFALLRVAPWLLLASQASRAVSTPGLARLAALPPGAYRRGGLPRPF